jgi:hypothetical protein
MEEERNDVRVYVATYIGLANFVTSVSIYTVLTDIPKTNVYTDITTLQNEES